MTIYKLIVEDDQGRRKVLPVELGEIRLGRDPSNEVCLKERNVSRRHARIFSQGDAVFIADLDSYNGLLVNGSRISGEAEIGEGDVVQLGDFQLELRGEGAVELQDETTDRTDLGAGFGHDRETTSPGHVSFDEDDLLEDTAISGPPKRLGAQEAKHHSSKSPRQQDRSEAERGMASDRPPSPKPMVQAGPEPTAVIRVSDLQAMAKPSGASASADLGAARSSFLLVSSSLAGQVLEIETAEAVIGRTPDNALVVEHRSVSRHHAKVVVQGGRTRIVDLGSANGTLINGEAYADIELKHADLVELGHVKMRFLAAEMRYTPTPQERQRIRQAQSGSKMGLAEIERFVGLVQKQPPAVIAALAIALCFFMVLLFANLFNSEDKAPKARAELTPVLDVGAEERDDTVQGVGALMFQARQAFRQQNWPRALALVQAVLALAPGHADAQALMAQAQSEQEATANLRAAQRAVAARNWQEAWDAAEAIPLTSLSARKGRALQAEIAPRLASQTLMEGRRALAEGDREAAMEAMQALEDLDAGMAATLEGELAAKGADTAPRRGDEAGRDSTAVESVRNKEGQAPRSRAVRTPAKPASRSPRRSRSGNQSGASTGSKTGSGSKASARSKSDSQADTSAKPIGARAHYEEGARAIRRGDMEEGIESFSRCILADRKYCLCYRALGISYARQRNTPKAARYYKLYLKICPGASDASKVRALLEQYDG